MNAIIKQIQNSLEHGRPMNATTGDLAAAVLKEIQKSNAPKQVFPQQKEIS